MNANLKIAKQIRRKPGPNQYALENEELNWEHCRENFSKIFKQHMSGLFFSHLPENDSNISSFIQKTEQILIVGALQKINKSKFYNTNLNFALWVEPSSFWMKCPMKRSLFTLLLRCGSYYDKNKDNYEEALYSVDYSKSTKKALQRFLYGFTEFSYNGENFEGIGKGWVSYFANKDCSSVCSKLKSPKEFSKTNFLFGGEILWA